MKSCGGWVVSCFLFTVKVNAACKESTYMQAKHTNNTFQLRTNEFVLQVSLSSEEAQSKHIMIQFG